MHPKWIVVCVIVGLALLAVVVAVQGLTPWTALLAVLLVVCPLLGIWMMRQSRDLARRHDMYGNHVE